MHREKKTILQPERGLAPVRNQTSQHLQSMCVVKELLVQVQY